MSYEHWDGGEKLLNISVPLFDYMIAPYISTVKRRVLNNL